MDIFSFFIKNKKFTMILTVMVVIFGLNGLKNLPSEAFPNVNMGVVKISTYYGGASASDIELKITKPIEEKIRSVSGLKKVRSVSQPGISSILTVVDIDNYSADDVIPDLQRALDSVTNLPNDLQTPPAFLEVKSEEFPLIELAITGGNSDRERFDIAEMVKEELEDNKKISGIQLPNFPKKYFAIKVDPDLLIKNKISLEQVSQSIQLRNRNIPGGFIETLSKQSLIKMDGKVTSLEELRDIVIRANFSGRTIRLSDVATIEESSEDPKMIASQNGEPAALMVVTKKAGTDLIDLADEVYPVLERVTKEQKNKFKFTIYNDEAKRVKNKVAILASNAFWGLILVVFFLIIFLPGRAGVMSALSLPLAMLATLGYMAYSGMTINTVTILALIIALGMLVDNSVVISENFNRLLSEGNSTFDAAYTSVKKLWLPISLTAFTTIAAFLPMLVTKGIMGQFIKYIPLIITASLLISLGESFFLLPARLVTKKAKKNGSSEGASEPEASKGDWFTNIILPRFENVMSWLIKKRYVGLVLFTVLIFGSLVLLLKFNKVNLFPSDQTEIYIGRVMFEQGTDIKTTDKVLADVASRIKSDNPKFVLNAISKAGADMVGPNDPKEKVGESVGQLVVLVNDYGKNELKTDDVVKILNSTPLPSEYGKIELSFEAIANGPPVGSPVEGVFRSGNKENLDAVIKGVIAKLESTKGIKDVQVNDVVGEDVITVDIDYKLADRLGLNASSIGSTIRTAFSGQVVGDITQNDKEIDLFVRLKDSSRKSIEDIENLRIKNFKGDLIPLKLVAKLNSTPPEAYLKRYDFKTSRTITANIDEAIMTVPKANRVMDQAYAELRKTYPDVNLTYGGAGESTKESMSSLAEAMILSLIGIFALLVFLFKSYLKPVIIMTTIPLGFVGISIAFFLQGFAVSFMAMIGIIGLGGIIVNSGIVLVSFIEDMKEETDLTLKQILIKASGIRLRAVIVTALTTVSGLLPTAYGLGGSDKFIIPLAMAMAWGLVSGTILTLIWIPCAYAISEDMIYLFNKLTLRKPKDSLEEVSSGELDG